MCTTGARGARKSILRCRNVLLQALSQYQCQLRPEHLVNGNQQRCCKPWFQGFGLLCRNRLRLLPVSWDWTVMESKSNDNDQQAKLLGRFHNSQMVEGRYPGLGLDQISLAAASSDRQLARSNDWAVQATEKHRAFQASA